MNRIEESICFYTRNDYLLINDLLWGNRSNIEKSMQIITEDSKACPDNWVADKFNHHTRGPCSTAVDEKPG